jgi:hypothetical protein
MCKKIIVFRLLPCRRWCIAILASGIAKINAEKIIRDYMDKYMK